MKRKITGCVVAALSAPVLTVGMAMPASAGMTGGRFGSAYASGVKAAVVAYASGSGTIKARVDWRDGRYNYYEGSGYEIQLSTSHTYTVWCGTQLSKSQIIANEDSTNSVEWATIGVTLTKAGPYC